MGLAAMGERWRIALLIDTATTWGAGIIEGVCRYATEEGRQWVVDVEPRGLREAKSLPKTWRGHGVIRRMAADDGTPSDGSSGVPTVHVSEYGTPSGALPSCSLNVESVAQLAHGYLTKLGYRRFAYCGRHESDPLADLFAEEVREAVWEIDSHYVGAEETASRDPIAEFQRLLEWVRGLTRPVAVLCDEGFRGAQLTAACAQAGLSIPDEVAVLVGQHDDLCSRISDPPLSGVDHDTSRLGYAAAQILGDLMRGDAPRVTRLVLPPRGLVTRRSTELGDLKDDMLSHAVRFIRENYAKSIRIDDILEAVPLSRRSLEIGFRRQLGRSPREEIQRIRVQKATELLCDTQLPLMKIAADSGFDRPELLTRAFRRVHQMTPTEYRRRFSERATRRRS